MSETATEKTYTSEELDQMWATVPDAIKDAINTLNEQIDAHNKDVALIKAASGDEAKTLLFEYRDQNPKEDSQLSKFNAEITKLNERIEQLTKQANERAAEVYASELKTPTEDEIKTARDRVSESGAAIRTAMKATTEFGKLLSMPLEEFFKDVQSLRGSGLRKSSSSGEKVWRPRLTAIYLNGEKVEAAVKNSEGVDEMRSTFNILNTHLNKLTNGKNFSVVDLQQAYLNAGGGDKDKLPETVEFTLPFEKGDTKLEFNIKVVK